MSDNSLIEWCSATWNFLIGCTKKSFGCMHCYAIRQAWRMMHNPNPKIAKKFEGTVHKDSKGELNWTGRVNFDEDLITKPLSWRLPRRVFVNSLSDLFHKNVKDEWIDMAFAVMAMCPQHTFQILTKEPERMRDHLLGESAQRIAEMVMLYRFTRDFNSDYEFDARDADLDQWPLPNVHLGTSVEDQKTADERIPLLLQTPAAVRWISAEPLLGPIDLGNMRAGTFNGLDGIDYEDIGDIRDPGILSKSEIPKLDWLVCGGESGPKARPMHPDWARSLRDQCVAAGVPFFFKQWGEWAPTGPLEAKNCAVDRQGRITQSLAREDFPAGASSADGWQVMYREGKKAAGRLLDGKEWSEYPKAKAVAAAL